MVGTLGIHLDGIIIVGIILTIGTKVIGSDIIDGDIEWMIMLGIIETIEMLLM